MSMTDFEEAYARWREAPFPRGSTNDLVGDLHADLAMLDAFVADEVIPLREGAVIRPGAVDIAKELDGLCSRIRSLAAIVEAEQQAKLGEYAEYCALLEEVYSGAQHLYAPPRPGGA